VDLIAREAGCSMSSFYARFPSKDVLIEAFFDEFFARSHADAVAAIGDAPAESLLAAVHRVVDHLVDGYRRHRGVLRAMILHDRGGGAGSFAGRTTTLRREYGQLVVRLLVASSTEAQRDTVAKRAGAGLWVADAAAQHAVLLDKLPGVDDTRLRRLIADVWLAYLSAPVG
jgi:AcrR family transcriptional regulator